jgi:chlorite dismutase
MPDSRLPPLTLDGSYVLHQGFRLAWPRLRELDTADRERVGEEFAELLAGWDDLGQEGWSGSYRMVGGGLDLMLVHFRSDLEGLADAEKGLRETGLFDHAYLEMDFLSVVELGLYRLTVETVEELRADGIAPTSEEGRQRQRAAADEHRQQPYVQGRLYPGQPEDMPYVCFYPMDKRREPGCNWYTLPLEERNEMMVEHGEIGRRYAGRISQVISGSVGLDDWEWGVTLFAGDPLEFKKLVTEMRYDEVSALYAEFGAFYVGRRLAPSDWREELTSG